MKGVVFNLLEQVVVGKYGETVWDDLLDARQTCPAPIPAWAATPMKRSKSLVAAAFARR